MSAAEVQTGTATLDVHPAPPAGTGGESNPGSDGRGADAPKEASSPALDPPTAVEVRRLQLLYRLMHRRSPWGRDASAAATASRERRREAPEPLLWPRPELFLALRRKSW